MAKSIFITATGTDIGKTYISALIVKKMREYGFNCGYYKPVLSGLETADDGTLIPGDCCHVVKTSGLNINPKDCTSYCFKAAVSPHLASKEERINIDIDKIKSDYNKLSDNYDYMVVEGAGGITCPIKLNGNDYYLMNNLIKDLNQEIVIVADSGLGTLNSIITTVEYARQKHIKIAGLILNNFDKTNYMHLDNLYMAEKLTGENVIAKIENQSTNIEIDKESILEIFR